MVYSNARVKSEPFLTAHIFIVCSNFLEQVNPNFPCIPGISSGCGPVAMIRPFVSLTTILFIARLRLIKLAKFESERRGRAGSRRGFRVHISRVENLGGTSPLGPLHAVIIDHDATK